MKYDRNVRFPWIHRREPFDIQSLNGPASKNHVGGSLLETSHAVLWFVDGSGGDNHLRTSSSIWFPVAEL
jgi:hypothetical protein